jgi:hypothetical protein
MWQEIGQGQGEMNFERLKAELMLAAHAYEDYHEDWINDAVLEVAYDFELPDLRLTSPATLSVTTANWLYDMPDTYHKKAFKCRNSSGRTLMVKNDIQDIELLDYDHSDTGDSVTIIAIENGQIAVYPKANDTLSLWYYRLPTPMTNDSDVPDGIPVGYAERVIISKALVKNFRLVSDMAINQPNRSIQYWDQRYREALYGVPGGDIGMIHYFAKLKGVRIGGDRNMGRYI